MEIIRIVESILFGSHEIKKAVSVRLRTKIVKRVLKKNLPESNKKIIILIKIYWQRLF